MEKSFPDVRQVLQDLCHQSLIQLLNNCIINQNKKQSIEELKSIFQDPLKLQLLFGYYGISQEVLLLPAHRLQLEEIAKLCLETLINNDFSIVGLNKQQSTIIIELGSSLFVTNRLHLIINDDGYYNFTIVSNSYTSTYKTETTTLTIIGFKDKISICEKGQNSTSISLVAVNKNGFASGIITKNNRGEQLIKLKQGRISVGEYSGSGSVWSPITFSWNGNPLHLNTSEPSKIELGNNIKQTLARNPKSLEFYLKSLGKDVIADILNEEQAQTQ